MYFRRAGDDNFVLTMHLNDNILRPRQTDAERRLGGDVLGDVNETLFGSCDFHLVEYFQTYA